MKLPDQPSFVLPLASPVELAKRAPSGRMKTKGGKQPPGGTKRGTVRGVSSAAYPIPMPPKAKKK